MRTEVNWHPGNEKPPEMGRYHVIVDHGAYRKRMRLWWDGKWLAKDSGHIVWWTADVADPDGDFLYM